MTIEQSERSKATTLENPQAYSWEMPCSIGIFCVCPHHKDVTRFKSDILAARSNNDKALSPSVTGIPSAEEIVHFEHELVGDGKLESFM